MHREGVRYLARRAGVVDVMQASLPGSRRSAGQVDEADPMVAGAPGTHRSNDHAGDRGGRLPRFKIPPAAWEEAKRPVSKPAPKS